MKHLLSLAFWFGVGYVTVWKVAPTVQAKLESLDIDAMWADVHDVWGDE